MYTYKARITRVVDADTLDAEVDVGFGVYIKMRLRLARVNAPEIHGVKKDSEEYKAGMASTDFVVDWLKLHGWEVVIQTDKDKTGKYGRYIAEVYKLETDNNGEVVIQSISLNESLLNEGYAVLYD